MKLFLLLFLTMLFSSCGLTLHSDPVRVEPITVTHNIKVDPTLLRAYFTEICKKDVLLITDQQISDCVAQKMDEFLNGLSYSGVI